MFFSGRPQEALQQRAREVDIAHVEESRAVLEGVVARLRESLAAKDAAVLAAQPPLVRDLQVCGNSAPPVLHSLLEFTCTGRSRAGRGSSSTTPSAGRAADARAGPAGARTPPAPLKMHAQVRICAGCQRT